MSVAETRIGLVKNPCRYGVCTDVNVSDNIVTVLFKSVVTFQNMPLIKFRTIYADD